MRHTRKVDRFLMLAGPGPSESRNGHPCGSCEFCTTYVHCYYYIGTRLRDNDGLSKLRDESLAKLAVDTIKEIDGRLNAKRKD